MKAARYNNLNKTKIFLVQLFNFNIYRATIALIIIVLRHGSFCES